MAEKSTLAQQVQVGPEVTQGTGVAADILLQSIKLGSAIKLEAEPFAPAGYKYPTIMAVNKEWSEVSVEGKPTYDEIIYLLSSVGEVATITTPGGTNPRLWTFTPGTTGADTVVSYTIENGESGAGNARKVVGCVMNEFELTVARDEVSVGGNFVGMQMTTGQTLTGTPTALPVYPILPTHAKLWLDSTGAGLGTTLLTRAFKYSFKIGNRFGTVWPVDSTNTSYAATVETVPDAQVTLLMAADTAGMALITPMRAGDTRFVRLKCTGPLIESTYYRELTIDTALKVREVSEFTDEDGVYAIEYTFDVVHDATWTKAWQATVQCSTTAL